MIFQPGADLGGGGRTLLFRDSSTPSRPKWPPLCTILRYPFLGTDPKIFLKASSAPIYTNFEGEARAEKRAFLVKIFQKRLKMPFWPVFQKYDCDAKKLAEAGSF